jgi:hypothetical protein
MPVEKEGKSCFDDLCKYWGIEYLLPGRGGGKDGFAAEEEEEKGGATTRIT